MNDFAREHRDYKKIELDPSKSKKGACVAACDQAEWYGFIDLYRMRCTACSEGCSACDTDEFGHCTACLPGYWTATFAGDDDHPPMSWCEPCHTSCETCDGRAPDQCLTCAATLTLDAVAHTCSGLSSCDEFCLTCDATHCYQCSDGHFVDDPENTMVCKACSPGCLKCKDSDHCFECKP